MNTRAGLFVAALPIIGGLASGGMPPQPAPATSCPRIAAQNRPALLFVEGPADASHLFVAYEDGGAVHREPILSARYIEVTQLARAVFLVSALEDTRAGKVFVLNFDSGTIKCLAENTWMACLRAEPQRQAAMLIEWDLAAGRVRLIELDLVRLETKERWVLTKARLGDEFAGVGPTMRISPDFSHIAYMSRTDERPAGRSQAWALKLLDPQSLASKILDRRVNVEISIGSSFPQGKPPFEWINNRQILYQDILGDRGAEPDSRERRTYVFKIVDVATGVTTECFRKQFQLTLTGGRLAVDPLTGRLIHSDLGVLDPEKKALTDSKLPVSVRTSPASRTTEIMVGTKVLYRGGASFMDVRVSASGRHVAYLLRPPGAMLAGEIFAVFRIGDRPIRIAQGDSAPTWPVGWIE